MIEIVALSSVGTIFRMEAHVSTGVFKLPIHTTGKLHHGLNMSDRQNRLVRDVCWDVGRPKTQTLFDMLLNQS